MSTVSDYTALLSGRSWNPSGETGKPLFVTYSFETRSYEYLDRFAYFDTYKATFQPLTDVERQQALVALGQWDQASGIRFLEVPAGQGDIRFGTYDFSGEPGLRDSLAYAYFPDLTDDFDAARGGDVYLDRTVASSPASDILHVLLHEIGHALGLKHPFDGETRLDGAYDSTAYTVMSYTGLYTTTLSGFDNAAIQALYGSNAADGTQAIWSWDAATATLTQQGGAQNDTLVGVSTTDVLDGQGGEDVLYGRGGGDRLRGGDAHDLIMGDDGDDVLSGDGASDGLWGGNGNDRLDGGADGDSLYGEGGNDTLIGGAGEDLLLGGDSDDTLRGGSGNDTLDGEDGNDRLFGEDGDDVLYGGYGLNGLLDGGAGNDTVYAAGSHGGLPAIAGASTLRGGRGHDTLYGDRWNDRLDGGDGNDVVYGGDGSDTATGGAGADRLFGEIGNDRLEGGAGDDRLDGGAGDDTLDGGRGGGIEGDTVDYGDAYAQVRVDLSGMSDTGEVYHAIGSEIGHDIIRNVENVVGGRGSDVLKGDAAANRLSGRAGNDRLEGGAGNDTLVGEAGDDRLVGGTGDDTLDGGRGGGIEGDTADYGAVNAQIRVDLSGMSGAGEVYHAIGSEIGRDIIRNVENVVGGRGSDVLKGDAAANRLSGGAGNDRLEGGAGNDTLVGEAGDDRLVGGAGDDILDGGRGGGIEGDTADYGAVNAQIRVDLSGMSGTGEVYHAIGSEIGRDIIRNVENVVGGRGSDVLKGDAAANRLSGRAGNDRLGGHDGADILDGGDGADRLEGGAGNDALLGGAGDDTLVGEAGDDRLVGGAGDDILDGGRGGGIEGDTADYGAVNAQIRVDLSGMHETVDGKAVIYHARGTEVGRDVLKGVENVTGGSRADILIGNAAANHLAGNGGNDTLKGGAGNDTLTGGAGADRFVFDTKPAVGNADRITDFTVGSDKLWLDDDVFTALKAGRIAEGQFSLGAAAKDADDRLIFDTASKSLFYDADGTGAQTQVKVAVLDKVAALHASDFLIVV